MTSAVATSTRCCIVGGGPAGMMLGFLLARAGVDTVVLEKHADFLRDFRGDTVHPSTLRIVDELGLLDAFLRVPHQKLRRMSGLFGDERLSIADFSGLPERYAYIAFMPQWDFLDFLAAEGRRLPRLEVRMRARVDALIEEDGRVAGVRGSGEDGPFELRAALTVGCDGRHSTVRDAAALPLQDIGAPIDVMWFRVGRDGTVFDDTLARITPGRMIVTIDRGDYWQCAFVIAKGRADVLRSRGIESFRAEVAAAAPILAGRVGDIASWDDVKLLAVSVDRLTDWSRPGLLCIGDAAHAMSPVGGVGINLAIQDAVATANALAVKLGHGGASLADIDASLDDVRRRRLFPTRVTQALQVQVQNNVLAPVISGANAELEPPLPMRLLSALPPMQRVFARVIGMGVRPEHVRSPRAAA
ncbi:MAG: FAD-dependent oxidoreductase [Caldimonas sp.]